jgi:hypothetical protein
LVLFRPNGDFEKPPLHPTYQSANSSIPMSNSYLFFALFASASLLASPANAASIVYSFTGGTAGATANGFGGDVAANAISIINGGSNGWEIGSTQIDELDAISMKFGGTADAAFSLTLDIGSTPINLTGLSFAFDYESNNGAGADYFAKWDVAISAGSSSPATGSVGPYSPGNTVITTSEDLALSGLTDLQNNSVTFTFTADNGTNTSYTSGNANDRRTIFDDITITGAVVPEPSAALLGSLGALTLLRRRRTHD